MINWLLKTVFLVDYAVILFICPKKHKVTIRKPYHVNQSLLKYIIEVRGRSVSQYGLVWGGAHEGEVNLASRWGCGAVVPE